MLKNKSLGGKIKFIVLFLVLIVASFVNGYDGGVDKQQEEAQESQQDEGNVNDAEAGNSDGNDAEDSNVEDDSSKEASVTEDGTYTSKEEVAEYIYLYEKLPSNFITKKEAQKLGWDNSKGNLAEVAPGMSIGGDYFGNYEGNLPEADGRDYYECDINYESGYRGSERIVYSDDGLIYYTADHYETFELLYGEE